MTSIHDNEFVKWNLTQGENDRLNRSQLIMIISQREEYGSRFSIIFLKIDSDSTQLLSNIAIVHAMR